MGSLDDDLGNVLGTSKVTLGKEEADKRGSLTPASDLEADIEI